MTRDEARIRVHKAIIEAGHVDRVDSILADLLMTVRAEAFEEAARVCDLAVLAWAQGGPSDRASHRCDEAVECAEAIRRLAGKPG